MIDFAVLQEATSLLVIYGLVTTVCAFLIVYAKVGLWFRAVLIPLVLALTFVGYITLVDVLGRPYPGIPPDRAVLIDYQVDIRVDSHGIRSKKIVLWVYVNGDYRLYRIPYDRPLENQLIDADNDVKNGKPRKQIKTNTGAEGNDSPIDLYEIPWKDYMPKDAAPEDQ